MYLVDYHLHPYSHGEEKIKKLYSKKLIKEFLLEAQKKGITEVGFSDHDQFIPEIDWTMMAEVKEEFDSVKLGLEVDFTTDKSRLEELKQVLKEIDYDYLIGSVHTIDGWSFDHPDYIEEYQKYKIDDLYATYFQLLKEAVSSGLFQIVGHLDLIKIFGFRPQKLRVEELVVPVLKEIKSRGMAIEVNTNGLNKPVKEIYPSFTILKLSHEFDIPVTLGSDAHEPQRTGENIKKAARLIKDIGYEKIATFNKRELNLKELTL